MWVIPEKRKLFNVCSRSEVYTIKTVRKMKLITVFAFLIMAAFVVSALPQPAESQEGSREFKSTHLNLKANELLSPETEHKNDTEAQTKRVNADYDSYPGLKANRRWVDVGTWTSSGVAGSFTIKGSVVFNIWFKEIDDGTDNSPDWKFELKRNDETIASAEVDGTNSDPDNVIEVTASASLAQDIQVNAGDKLSLNIQYRGWEDCDVYYDNVTYDSGFRADMDSIVILKAGADSSVCVKFFDAFGINWDRNGKFFCTVSYQGHTIYGNEATEVSEGGEIEGDNGTSYQTTKIKFNEAKPTKGTSVTVTLSYSPIENGTSSGWTYTFTVSESESSSSGIGGLGGDNSTPLVAVVVVIVLGAVGGVLYMKRKSAEGLEDEEEEEYEEEEDYEEEE